MVNPIDCLSAKISLLSLINNLPERPNINTFSEHARAQNPQPNRTLLPKHEISITQQLAFICAYSDDSLHVIAICVEESPGGCIFRFAANTGEHEVLINGLESISQILQNEAINVNRPTNHETLVKAVVALNRRRILSRIRSRHATSWKAKGKAPLLQKLRIAKGLLRDSSNCTTRVQSLAKDVDNLQRQFNRLENMDSFEAQSPKSEKHLLGLVESIHIILLEYEQDLKLVPYTPGRWNGNDTDSLMDRLRKISQYIKVCEELLKAARRYTIFSNITVQFIDLQQKGRRLSLHAASDADEIIDASFTTETLSRVSSRRQKSISNTRESIKARLGEKSRLHAELQLVLYYERDNLLRPRVICSSKSACYLCHLFLKLHGQYHIPSSHGKLYDTWKWPAPTQLHNTTGRGRAEIDLQCLLPEFANAIDRKIQDCLNTTKIVKRIEPLESRVDLLTVMTPSIISHVSRRSLSVHSEAPPHQELEGIFGGAPLDNGHVDGESLRTNIKTIRELEPLFRAPAPQVDTQLSPIVDTEDSIYSSGTTTPTLTRHASKDNFGSSLREVSVLEVALCSKRRSQEAAEMQREPLCLGKGEVAKHSFDVKNGFLRVQVPGLHVTLQYDTYHTQGSRLEMDIECLSSSIHYGKLGLAQVVDLEEGDWIEKTALEGLLFSTEGLLLKQKTTFLRLCARATDGG